MHIDPQDPSLCTSSFSFIVSLLDNLYTFELKRFQRPINLTVFSMCAYLHIHVLVYTYSQANETTEMTVKTKKARCCFRFELPVYPHGLPLSFPKLSREKNSNFVTFSVTRDIYNAENHSSVEWSNVKLVSFSCHKYVTSFSARLQVADIGLFKLLLIALLIIF